MPTLRKGSKVIICAFLAPALFLYFTFFLYPAIDAFRISFYSSAGFSRKMNYVGMANFKELLFHDSLFWSAVKNTFFIVVVDGFLIFAVALFLAMVFSRSKIKGKEFFKTIIILPIAISEIGIGIGWTFIFNSRWGLLNSTLKAIGLEQLAKPWLGSSEFALPVISIVIFWSFIGFYTLLLLAGLQSIPPVYEEAARIDGANKWQQFWKEHKPFKAENKSDKPKFYPLLKGIFVISFLYWIIFALKIFGIVWILTGQGLGSSTFVISTYMYKEAFGEQVTIFRFGYGTAIAVLLFIFTIAFSVIYLRLVTREEVQY